MSLAAAAMDTNPTEPRPASATEADLAAARGVLAIESQALDRVAMSLGAAFLAVCDMLEQARGRVVVTGMGKSGHVAVKIAATFASTGTPAQFVHPAEAAHGDLGMITPTDAVLALSNSGETPELQAILVHARRFGIPLAAVVGRAPSTLADTADAALVLPPLREACPMGLAPTSSTTAMLALGDALAVVLLGRRGFSPTAFADLHPGGKLGAKLVRVHQLMHAGTGLPLVHVGTRMDEALLVMTRKRLGCVGVIDDCHALVGIVTDGDLRRHMAHDLLARPIEALMNPGVRTIGPDALAVEAVRIMNEQSITVLFVVADDRPVGAIHLHDCLKAGVA
ncbi:MAG TPA: KpsF/GutQ family sugar-phosphate isomerase [Geminicoccus sp.]|jgi:arabinose-5-phosphate isomerase|uniref:KpsF/GutQ family sugar-phosphate isomerase n=1 Tax=Geminicoccus sp. TaxID=2024832 RepID=UPI002E32F989|nr:KpsF/GutQ family sugar-phosphate isomerase [Geminicoccus sp.]HEX2524738.1 KpsF/GutQ family sugar-phosphate isomerase [Geminicoccus sp.]